MKFEKSSNGQKSTGTTTSTVPLGLCNQNWGNDSI